MAKPKNDHCCGLEAFETNLLSSCKEVTDNMSFYSPEADYQLALQKELTKAGYEVMTEVVTSKKYKNKPLDHGKNDRLDLVVLVGSHEIILELKSVDSIKDRHRIQLTNYLFLDKLTPGYLINFQEKDGNIQIEKLIHTKKPILQSWFLEKDPSTIFEFEKDTPTTKDFTKWELSKICEKLGAHTNTNNSRQILINNIKAKLLIDL